MSKSKADKIVNKIKKIKDNYDKGTYNENKVDECIQELIEKSSKKEQEFIKTHIDVKMNCYTDRLQKSILFYTMIPVFLSLITILFINNLELKEIQYSIQTLFSIVFVILCFTFLNKIVGIKLKWISFMISIIIALLFFIPLTPVTLTTLLLSKNLGLIFCLTLIICVYCVLMLLSKESAYEKILIALASHKFDEKIKEEKI